MKVSHFAFEGKRSNASPSPLDANIFAEIKQGMEKTGKSERLDGFNYETIHSVFKSGITAPSVIGTSKSTNQITS